MHKRKIYGMDKKPYLGKFPRWRRLNNKRIGISSLSAGTFGNLRICKFAEDHKFKAVVMGNNFYGNFFLGDNNKNK